jgi:hypothetical protein
MDFVIAKPNSETFEIHVSLCFFGLKNAFAMLTWALTGGRVPLLWFDIPFPDQNMESEMIRLLNWYVRWACSARFHLVGMVSSGVRESDCSYPFSAKICSKQKSALAARNSNDSSALPSSWRS